MLDPKAKDSKNNEPLSRSGVIIIPKASPQQNCLNWWWWYLVDHSAFIVHDFIGRRRELTSGLLCLK